MRADELTGALPGPGRCRFNSAEASPKVQALTERFSFRVWVLNGLNEGVTDYGKVKETFNQDNDMNSCFKYLALR